MRNIFNESELESNLKDFFEIGRHYFEEEKGLMFLEGLKDAIEIGLELKYVK